MNARSCPNCSTISTNPWAKFCTKCGGVLPEAAEVSAPSQAAWPPPGAWVAPPAGAMMPPWHMPQPRTAGSAVAAQNLGIVSFFVWFRGVFTAPPAIILGVVGRRKVTEAPAQYSGRGMATAGLVLGLVWMILATMIVSLLVFARVAGQ